MNAVWSTTNKSWKVTFYGSSESWSLKTMTFGEGVVALSQGGFIRNNMLIVPAPKKFLEPLDFKKAYLVEKV